MDGFLTGVLTAWTASHLGLALFFALAFALARRESEYLVFSLLCAAFSVLTGGVAYDVASSALTDRILADQITHAGAALASALNVHFAWCFLSARRSIRLIAPIYVVAAVLIAVSFTGLLWIEGSYRFVEGHPFGMVSRQARGQVSALGAVYYAVSAAEAGAALVMLWLALRRGRREALTSLLGAVVVVVAIVNDVALALGWLVNTLALLPHVFLLYALGAAGTLLWRYRLAAGELEQTTNNLRLRTEELRKSYADLAEVQSELVTKKQLAAVGELAAAIAHEVRNPLAVIVNAVAGLRRTELAGDDRTMLLGIVEEEAGRLNRLVTDLLRFARPVNVKRSPVSLIELAKRTRLTAADGHDVRVHADDDPSVHTVHVDPNLFRLVFDNLVANAFQAMRDGGIVDISIDRGELQGRPAARIEIKDSGHGMEPQVRARALDPFFTTRPSGTGLGLPIVQRIVEAHGGELVVDSEEGEGTRVTIIVPSFVPEEPADGASAEQLIA